MAPGLVTAEKAARGKLPTDVWWHTIVPTNGAEKTGYPTQKPEGIVRRMRAGLHAPRRLVPRLLRRQRHARRRRRQARPPLRADRLQSRGRARDARAAGGGRCDRHPGIRRAFAGIRQACASTRSSSSPATTSSVCASPSSSARCSRSRTSSGLLLWAIAALLAAIANWFATLLLGALAPGAAPLPRRVRQIRHAALRLSAPRRRAATRRFDGHDGYPVDVDDRPARAPEPRERAPARGPAAPCRAARRRARWRSERRGSAPASRSSPPTSGCSPPPRCSAGSRASRAPRCRAACATAMLYALSYGAQFWGYALLLTDRYPDSDPQALAGLPSANDPIRLDIERRSAPQSPDRLLPPAARAAAPRLAAAVGDSRAPRCDRELVRDALRRALARSACTASSPATCATSSTSTRSSISSPTRSPGFVGAVRQLSARSRRRRARAPESLEDRLSLDPRASCVAALRRIRRRLEPRRRAARLVQRARARANAARAAQRRRARPALPGADARLRCCC